MSHECAETGSSLGRLREGKTDALAELFGSCRPRLTQMLHLRMQGRLAARVDPSDVLQETYLDANRKLQAYLRDPKVSTYVWLRGLTLDRLKKVQREHLGAQCRAVGRELRLPEESSLAFAHKIVANGPSPSNAVMASELRQRVMKALLSLKEEDCEVLLMRHFEGMSNREVAETLGLGISGATMRHGRALFRLREMLLSGLDAGESSP